MALDQSKIRSLNLRRVYGILRNQGALPRRELAEASGLSLMTISNLVDQLQTQGLVTIEGEKGDNPMGRKAELVNIDRQARQVLIIDLTRRNARYTVLNAALEEAGQAHSFLFHPNQAYGENFQRLLLEIDETLRQSGRRDGLAGVGICAPGPYLTDEDIIVNKRIQGLDEVRLKDALRAFFPRETLFIDEDVKLAAMDHIGRHSSIENQVAFYGFLGDGVGGTVIVDGKPVRGLNNVTGDIGQMLCGDEDNFEDHLSLPAVYQRWTGLSGREMDSEEMLCSLERLREENPAAFEAGRANLRSVVVRLLHNLMWLIDPHLVILESTYLSRLDPEMEAAVRCAFGRIGGPVMRQMPRIEISSGDAAGCYRGVAIAVIHQWLDNLT